MEINSRDMKKLAVLVSKTVQNVAFPEDFMHVNCSGKVISFIDTLEENYGDAEVLTTVRKAVRNIAIDKSGFYAVAKGLLREVNVPDGVRNLPSAVTFTPMVDTTTPVAPMRMAG